MPAWRILVLARTSRWPIAAGDTRNAEAIVAASRPSTACSISGARTPASIAGCAQANISARRSSGISGSASSRSRVLGEQLQVGGGVVAVRCRRARRSVCAAPPSSSQASGFVGQPFTGQSRSAAAKAPTARPRRPRHRACARRGRRRACRSCGARPRPPRAPRRSADRPRIASAASYIGQIGRTSTCRGSRPGSAPPTRARRRGRAHRSCSSRRAAPWSPHTAVRAPAILPLATRTVVAEAVGCNRSPPTMTPAFFIASV